jgi:hypothetical protein
MSQKLYFGGEYLISVERTFRDSGAERIMGMVGGEKVQLSAARGARPTILQSGDGYFYESYEPVKPGDDLEHIPPPYRARIEAWAQLTQGRARPKFVPTARQEEAARIRQRELELSQDPEIAAWQKREQVPRPVVVMATRPPLPVEDGEEVPNG